LFQETTDLPASGEFIQYTVQQYTLNTIYKYTLQIFNQNNHRNLILCMYSQCNLSIYFETYKKYAILFYCGDKTQNDCTIPNIEILNEGLTNQRNFTCANINLIAYKSPGTNIHNLRNETSN